MITLVAIVPMLTTNFDWNKILRLIFFSVKYLINKKGSQNKIFKEKYNHNTFCS